jgi:N-acetylglutamate synthase-like GNAT family acetyltransferase
MEEPIINIVDSTSEEWEVNVDKCTSLWTTVFDPPPKHQKYEKQSPDTLLLKKKEGEIIATIALTTVGREEYFYTASCFAVDPHSSKQGIGNTLMQRAIDFAKENGAKGICLDVRPENEHYLVPYYKKMNFSFSERKTRENTFRCFLCFGEKKDEEYFFRRMTMAIKLDGVCKTTPMIIFKL